MAHTGDLITPLAVSRERGAITRLKRVRNFTATRDRPEPSRFGEWSR